MGAKLTARQQAQLAWLESLPPKIEKATRIIEMISTMQAAKQLRDRAEREARSAGAERVTPALVRRLLGHREPA